MEERNVSREGSLSESRVEELYRDVRRARESGKYVALSEAWRALAEGGDPRGEAEYGAILAERGSEKQALAYFRSSAQKGDPRGAFYLGQTLTESDAERAAFLISYAAVSGTPEAYLPFAALAKARGEAGMELYYTTLAALADDAGAALSLAYRYAEGEGVERDPGVAKWYLYRLGAARHFRAPGLCARLRGVEATYPPTPDAGFLDGFLLDLIAEADRLGYAPIRHVLTAIRAEKGDAEAAIRVLVDTVTGDGVAKDAERGIAELEKRAQGGSGAAYIALGDLYAKGNAVPRDTKRAMQAYSRAGEIGDPVGYRKLGDLYAATGTTGGAAYALTYYETAAQSGDTMAAAEAERIRAERDDLVRLGKELVDTDPAEAHRLFSRAAQMGYAKAEVLLADMYLSGIGVPVDRRRAFFGYRAAAGAGVTESYLPLGLCYSRGVGTRPDPRLAVKYLTLACDAGVGAAEAERKKLLDRKFRKMRRSLYAAGVELIHAKKTAKGAKFVFAAAARGEIRAMYTAGALAEFGIGVAPDRKVAALWYAKAAEEGFTDPDSSFKRQILRLIR